MAGEPAQDQVRCLDCGATYAKPKAGGTVSQNPGCPRCSYLGWIAVVSRPEQDERHRSAAGRIRLQYDLPR